MGDVQSGRCPTAHELIGVHLGPAGVRIVEVAPCQGMDAAHARSAKLVDVPLQIPRLQIRHVGRIWHRADVRP